MTTIDTRTPRDTLTAPLRTLYLVRAAFAVGWALLLVLTAASPGPLSSSLLLLYPLADLVAAVVDHRATRATKPAPALFVNMALYLPAQLLITLGVLRGAATEVGSPTVDRVA